ncbi:hypothetical protein [Anaeromicrobium sp.]|uniref:hypothetical protein n=1 Tax=Anaeromicrobium sp. TaxID=1929132 RepID=UPI0025FD81B6|nr:hypothetical protein [Anaeromicrobium sp.]
MSILLIMITMIVGIVSVDNSFRQLNKIDDNMALGYCKITKSLYEIHVCGEKLYIDEKKVKDKYISIKNNIDIFIRDVQNKNDFFHK